MYLHTVCTQLVTASPLIAGQHTQPTSMVFTVLHCNATFICCTITISLSPLYVRICFLKLCREWWMVYHSWSTWTCQSLRYCTCLLHLDTLLPLLLGLAAYVNVMCFSFQQISDTSVRQAAFHCPLLVSVNLSGCPQVSSNMSL